MSRVGRKKKKPAVSHSFPSSPTTALPHSLSITHHVSAVSEPRRRTFTEVVNSVESMFPGCVEHQWKLNTQSGNANIKDFEHFYDFRVFERVNSVTDRHKMGIKSPNMASLIMKNGARHIADGILQYIDSMDYHSLLDDCYSAFFFNFTARHIEHIHSVLGKKNPCANWEAELNKMTEHRRTQIRLLEISDGWENEFHDSLEFSHSFSRLCLYNAYQYGASVDLLAVLRSSKPELADVVCCASKMIDRLEYLISDGNSLSIL